VTNNELPWWCHYTIIDLRRVIVLWCHYYHVIPLFILPIPPPPRWPVMILTLLTPMLWQRYWPMTCVLTLFWYWYDHYSVTYCGIDDLIELLTNCLMPWWCAGSTDAFNDRQHCCGSINDPVIWPANQLITEPSANNVCFANQTYVLLTDLLCQRYLLIW